MKQFYQAIFCRWLLMAAVIFANAAVWAQEDAGSERYSRRTPVVEAFEKNKDAVVSISSKHLAGRRDDFHDFFSWLRPRMMVIPSLGSGFIIDQRGYILTNAHVIKNALEITIIMADGSQCAAEVIQEDRSADLALLKIEADKPLPVVKLRLKDDPMIGEAVLAIGNPFGYQQTLTEGIISAIHRDLEIDELVFPNLIQLSAPINPGNSGGPLLNINGEVIGINTAIRRAAQGIGFAIPISRLRERLPAMINLDSLRRIDFGLEAGDLPEDSRAEAKVLVRRVQAESAAAKAGFQVGDIITAIDDKKLASSIDFYLEMLEQKTNRQIKFRVKRPSSAVEADRSRTAETDEHEISLILQTRPKPDGALLARRLFGMKISSLTERAANRYGGAAEAGNIVVLEIAKNSPAHDSGIEPGDLLVGVGDYEISNVDQLGLILEQLGDLTLVNFTFKKIRRTGWGIRILQYETSLRPYSNGSAGGSATERINL